MILNFFIPLLVAIATTYKRHTVMDKKKREPFLVPFNSLLFQVLRKCALRDSNSQPSDP